MSDHDEKRARADVAIGRLDVMEGGVGVSIDAQAVYLQQAPARSSGLRSFVSATGETPVPTPDLSVTALSGYLKRRLGVPIGYTTTNKEVTVDESTSQAHDAWRESVGQDSANYEDFFEDDVVQELAEFAASGTAERYWMILGEPGSGKSTLMERFLMSLSTRVPSTSDVPEVHAILVRFRDLPELSVLGGGVDLGEVLWSHAYTEIRAGSAHAPAEPSRCVPLWLLDGWDEAPKGRYWTDTFLMRLQSVPGAKLFSCRTAVFMKDGRAARAERFFEPVRTYTVRDLNAAEQIEMLQLRLGTDASARDLHTRVRAHAQMRAVSRSPLLLAMLADSYRRCEDPSEFTLPAARADFYQAAIDQTWDSKLVDIQTTDEDADLRDEVLSAVARRIGLGRELWISRADMTSCLEEAGRIESTSERERLRNLIQRTGLLYPNSNRGYEFVHLTFQEYYLARSLERVGLRYALGEYWTDARYDEVLALLVSRACSKEPSAHGYLLAFYDELEQRLVKEPGFLYQCGRSALRFLLHVLFRAGIELEPLPDLLARLVDRARSSPTRMEAVASDPLVPPAVLSALAEEAPGPVQTALAKNPSSPPGVLSGLNARQFALELAKNPGTPTAVLDEIWVFGDNVDWWVASNPNASVDTLELLKQEGKVNPQLARNTALPPAMFRELAARGDEVVSAILSNDGASPELRRELGTGALRHRSVQLSRRERAVLSDAGSAAQAAEDPLTSPATLSQFAASGDPELQRKVAANPSVPFEAVRVLVHTQREDVLEAIAANRRTPASILAKLASVGPLGLAWRLAENTSTPAETLRSLAQRCEWQVLQSVASNPHTPQEVLTELALSKHPYVRREVVRNPSTILEDI